MDYTLLGKVITLPTLGFSKLFWEYSDNSLCSHNTSTPASQKGKFEVTLMFLKKGFQKLGQKLNSHVQTDRDNRLKLVIIDYSSVFSKNKTLSR